MPYLPFILGKTSMEDIEKLIDEATQRNLCVYDELAKSGFFTERLEQIANELMEQTCKTNVETVIFDIPSSAVKSKLPSNKTKFVLFLGSKKPLLGAY